MWYSVSFVSACFEVTINGDLVYSYIKHQAFPIPRDVSPLSQTNKYYKKKPCHTKMILLSICGLRGPRSACASAQADQGPRCPLLGLFWVWTHCRYFVISYKGDNSCDFLHTKLLLKRGYSKSKDFAPIFRGEVNNFDKCLPPESVPHPLKHIGKHQRIILAS